jgi:hypothetical protein
MLESKEWLKAGIIENKIVVYIISRQFWAMESRSVRGVEKIRIVC